MCQPNTSSNTYDASGFGSSVQPYFSFFSTAVPTAGNYTITPSAPTAAGQVFTSVYFTGVANIGQSGTVVVTIVNGKPVIKATNITYTGTSTYTMSVHHVCP